MTTADPRITHGWHSRRHANRDAQDAARERYLATRGRRARQARARQRQFAAAWAHANRTPARISEADAARRWSDIIAHLEGEA